MFAHLTELIGAMTAWLRIRDIEAVANANCGGVEDTRSCF